MIIAFKNLTPAQRREALRIHEYDMKGRGNPYFQPHEQIDAAIVSDLTGLVKDVLYYKEFLP